MSKYTTQLRFICETESGLLESVGYNDVDKIIQQSIPKIFSFDFPIFDEEYRNVLCTKILRRYYTREIGEEVYGLWKLRLETKLNEIMPFYNQMYESQLLKFEPLQDVNLTTEHGATKGSEIAVDERDDIEVTRDNTESYDLTVDKTGTVTDNTDILKDEDELITTTSDTEKRYSDTPQGSIENPESLGYLTNVTFDDGVGTQTKDNTASNSIDNTITNDLNDTHVSTKANDDIETTVKTKSSDTVANSTEDYINTVIGKSGGVSYSKMLQEFRKTFLNIDVMILDDLNDLFMLIW